VVGGALETINTGADFLLGSTVTKKEVDSRDKLNEQVKGSNGFSAMAIDGGAPHLR
jgi:hypothetical protein